MHLKILDGQLFLIFNIFYLTSNDLEMYFFFHLQSYEIKISRTKLTQRYWNSFEWMNIADKNVW